MKAYWIAHVDVSDAEQYTQYTQRAPAAFAKFGARFLARGGRSEAMEGGPARQRRPRATGVDMKHSPHFHERARRAGVYGIYIGNDDSGKVHFIR